MPISSNQLKKTASEIRKAHSLGKRPDKIYFENIHAYRSAHKEVVSAAFDELCDISKKVHNNSVVVFRLKRIDTIERKLIRLKTGLNRLQDIAGCRVIVDSLAQVYSIVEKIKNSSRFSVIRETDYISNPRNSGYKSYHLIIEMSNKKGQVEIQIRTRDHHYWATFVEITDYTFGVKLKEGDDDPSLLKFHQLLSKSYDEKLTDAESEEITSIEGRLKVLKSVLEIFKNNYLKACKNWINQSSKNDEKISNFILLEIKNKEPYFYFYPSFSIAEQRYFEKFTLEDTTNMVIVNINEPDISKLFLAYSNYVLVSHPSITRLLTVLSDVIIIKKKNADFTSLKTLKASYDDLVNYIETQFENEGILIDKLNYHQDNEKEIKSWYEGLQKRVEGIKKERSNLERKLDDITPKLTVKTAWPRFIYWLNN